MGLQCKSLLSLEPHHVRVKNFMFNSIHQLFNWAHYGPGRGLILESLLMSEPGPWQQNTDSSVMDHTVDGSRELRDTERWGMAREVLLELSFEGAQAACLAPKNPDLECTVRINSFKQEGSDMVHTGHLSRKHHLQGKKQALHGGKEAGPEVTRYWNSNHDN